MLWYEFLFLVMFLLGFFGILVCECVSVSRERKKESLRRDNVTRSLETIARYCYYKGKNENINMDID